MDRREQAARHVLGYESMEWCMAPILSLPSVDWQQVENLFPSLSSGEQALVRLASFLAGRSSIAGKPTLGIPVDLAARVDSAALRLATEAIALAPSESGAF